MKYAFVTRDDETSKKTALKIQQSLEKYFVYDEIDPEIVISIGGDGTILNAVLMLQHLDAWEMPSIEAFQSLLSLAA